MGAYLDCASTTQAYPEVVDAMLPYLKYEFGNPSSMHSLGRTASIAIDNSRELIAASIGAEPTEIYFTSGGSESNNWAIKGLKNPFRYHLMHIISSNIEHHSITSAINQRMLINEDIEYTFVKSDKAGLINPIDIADSIKLHTKLCSIMLVNNELGTIQPTSIIGEICKENNVIFHTDAVQAYGHMLIHVKKQNIDLMSTSAHKLHGPKGIGFLYISNDCKQQFMPLINGGQQERAMRASTENVAAIVGFAKAVEISLNHLEYSTKADEKIFNIIVRRLKEIPGIYINGDEKLLDKRHINISITGIRAEELMALLDEQGIYISTGSACNSKSNKPSHVLKAIGLPDKVANSSIRISFDYTFDISQINYFIECLNTDIEMLRASHG